MSLRRWAAAFGSSLSLAVFGGEVTHLKFDERIVFYPSFAKQTPGDDAWRAQVRGIVFEPERARVSLAALHEALELKTGEMSADEKEVFGRRARLFLVDHERRKKIFIRIGTNQFFVGKSGADGRFAGEIKLSGAEVIQFNAELTSGDERAFNGRLFPLEARGVSVISDIDDTIKVTDVRDRRATLRNTFLREFEAVSGMAGFYQALARSNGAAFHYVSASPWQLYEPLQQFVNSNGFPAGVFELKQFRWKDRSFFNLFGDPVKYKLGVIEPLMKKFPERRFILVGDSGERDPEIYGELARKFPGQVMRIYIRDVTNEPMDAARYKKAFRDVPRGRWKIFDDPAKIDMADLTVPVAD